MVIIRKESTYAQTIPYLKAMDYRRHYQLLVDRARTRIIDGYEERHHILPKCMGGGNEPGNMVSLTPEEHFVAHQLLVRIHPENKKLVYAAWAMTHGINRQNKKYGWLKRKRSDAQKGISLSDDIKEKISRSSKGRSIGPDRLRKLNDARRAAGTSTETRQNLSKSLTGKAKTEQHKAAMSAARLVFVYTPELRAKLAANKGKQLNEKQRAALLAATKGIPLSADHRAKLSAAKTGRLQPCVTCPHCFKSGGESLMKRWHFDKCKVQHV